MWGRCCNGLVQQWADNQHCLLKVMSGLKFLVRQGCGIGGHDDKLDRNLYQLMKLMTEDDPKVIFVAVRWK